MQTEALPAATPTSRRRRAPDMAPFSERRASKAREAVAGHLAAIDPERTLTHAELSAKLSAAVLAAGGETSLAEALGVSPQLVNHIRNGRQDIGRKLAEALGYEMRVLYVPLNAEGGR